MIQFRKLRADEIEARVATVSEKGCQILLYKNARCDMNILDEHEQIGPFNWQRDHKELKGNMYAGISIYDESRGIWVTKWDCGSESKTEAEKGEASDSFKRAAFNWGIGRELYTAPKIFINLDKGAWDEKGGKVVPKISFDVKEIHYDGEGNICGLVIVDGKGKEKYRFGKKQDRPATSPALSAPKSDKEMMHQGHEKWQAMLDSILAGKTTLEKVKTKYCFPEADEIAAKDWLLNHQDI